MLVIGLAASVGLLVASHVGGTTRTVAQRTTGSTVVPPSSAAPPATTTTTVDPKAISAGVASLLSHEGPTLQEVASAPASTRPAGGARHGKSTGLHVRK